MCVAMKGIHMMSAVAQAAGHAPTEWHHVNVNPSTL